MTREALGEAIGLLARYDHRVDLKLKQWEIALLWIRLEDWGVGL